MRDINYMSGTSIILSYTVYNYTRVIYVIVAPKSKKKGRGVGRR